MPRLARTGQWKAERSVGSNSMKKHGFQQCEITSKEQSTHILDNENIEELQGMYQGLTNN